MNDIEAPQFYDAQNIDILTHELHKAGFYNLSQLVKEQFQKIKDLEVEMEESVEAASEQGYESGYEEGQKDAQEYKARDAEHFADWFLNEFEPENKKKIKFKTINQQTFVIMTDSDYEQLKKQFHSMCD